jgi:hypothetical protein
MESNVVGLDDLLKVKGCLDAVDTFGFKDGVGGGIIDLLEKFDKEKSGENWVNVVTKLKDIEKWWSSESSSLGNVDNSDFDFSGEDILLFKDFKDFHDVSKKITDEFNKAPSTTYQTTNLINDKDVIDWFSQLKKDAYAIIQDAKPISIVKDDYNNTSQIETISDGKSTFTFDFKRFNDLLNGSITNYLKEHQKEQDKSDLHILQNLQNKITPSTPSYLALNTLVNSLNGTLKETVQGWISQSTRKLLDLTEFSKEVQDFLNANSHGGNANAPAPGYQFMKDISSKLPEWETSTGNTFADAITGNTFADAIDIAYKYILFVEERYGMIEKHIEKQKEFKLEEDEFIQGVREMGRVWEKVLGNCWGVIGDAFEKYASSKEGGHIVIGFETIRGNDDV